MISPWNGLPDQPERSGWHWLKYINDPARHPEWMVNWWDAESREWGAEEDPCTPKFIARIANYGGPTLNPTELAQMRKVERERDNRILLPTYDAFCNDAKGLMSGEFHFQGDEEECQECGGTGIEGEDDEGAYECMRCDGTGVRRERITVPWTTIKEIYHAIVDEYGPRALTDNEGKKT